MFEFKAKIFIFVTLLFSFNHAIADHGDSLYEVDIPVVDESSGVRMTAFRQGLDEVFVRISGDSIIMNKLKRPAATTYVKQFIYEPLEDATTNKQGEELSHRLKIQFNGHAMEKYLRDNGFPVWGQHRPDVVIWLAVRDGRNEYVLKSSDKSLLKTASDEALTRRGIPQKWPLYDKKDKKIVKIADIRGGFKEQVLSASKRYSRGPALTGSLTWNGKQWQSSWSLLMASGNQHWRVMDTDHSRLISKAIDQAADAMGVVFAIQGSIDAQQLDSVRLHVQAVNSIETYNQVETYLSELNAVEALKPLRVDGQNVLFEALLRSDRNDFLNFLKNDVKLAEIKMPQAMLQVTPEITPVTDNRAEIIPAASAGGSIATATTNQPAIEKQVPVYYYKFIQ